MPRTYSYDDEEGACEGRDVYVSSEESSVLGPDGEPLRKVRRGKIGFDLSPRKKTHRKTWV